MARPKNTYPAGPTPRKGQQRPPVTHEAIAADIEAFRCAGGKIEVLGVTRTLLRIDADPVPSPSPDTPSKEN